MEKRNIILEKSYDFSLKVIEVYKELYSEYQFRDLLRQLLRCGTSIGANVEEAVGGQTRKDFYAKLYIAYKEAREAHYWLRLLRDSNVISNQKAEELLNDCLEIRKIPIKEIRSFISKLGLGYELSISNFKFIKEELWEKPLSKKY